MPWLQQYTFLEKGFSHDTPFQAFHYSHPDNYPTKITPKHMPIPHFITNSVERRKMLFLPLWSIWETINGMSKSPDTFSVDRCWQALMNGPILIKYSSPFNPIDPVKSTNFHMWCWHLGGDDWLGHVFVFHSFVAPPNHKAFVEIISFHIKGLCPK